MKDRMKTNFTVSGMTCENRGRRVQSETFLLEPVKSVTADSKTGTVTVTVTSDASLDIEAVSAVVVEAGYVLVTD
jgi:copper chaperone CopZ